MKAAAMGAFALTAALSPGVASATEGGASLYAPGFHGVGAGVTPPPGFYFSNAFYAYSGEISASRRTQIGGAVLAAVKAEARADFVTGTWVTPLEILGGNLAFGLSVPFGVPRVSAGALIEPPRWGRTFAFSARDATLNVGDPLVTTLIGWRSGDLHWNLAASMNVPAGAYQEGELSNLAFNRWIGDVSASATYLAPAWGLDISGTLGVEFNGVNDATDYRSGNAVHLDLAIAKNLTKEFSLGVIAGYYHQVTGDGGRGDRVGPYKGRALAVGATAGYDFVVGQTPVSTSLSVLREVQVENRPQGVITLVTVAFPLGVSKPGDVAPTTKPLRARY